MALMGLNTYSMWSAELEASGRCGCECLFDCECAHVKAFIDPSQSKQVKANAVTMV